LEFSNGNLLDEKGILTHISRPLAELQEEFRLTGNKNQETRSAKQKKLDKLSTDDKRFTPVGTITAINMDINVVSVN
jgi:hypothetical protein